MKKATFLIFLLCIGWIVVFFIFAPKQAYMQGLLESWYARNGLIFYKDIASAYLPFLKFVMYFFHSIFGYSLNLSALLAPLFSIFLLTFLYIVSKKWVDGIYQAFPLVFFTLWNTYLGGNLFSATAFIGFLLLASFVAFISWWNNPKNISAFILGILFSFSILTIQIVAPFILVLSLGVLFKSIKGKQINLFAYFCLGVFLPFALVLVWARANNAINELFYWNLFYYFGGYPYGSLGKEPTAIFIFFAIHLSMFVFFISAKFHKTLTIFLVASVIVLMLSFWFAVFHPMRFQISLPIISLLLGWGLSNYSKDRKAKTKSFLIGTTFGLSVLALMLVIMPFFTTVLSAKNIGRLVSEVYPGDPMYDSVKWIKSNTPKESRIFVLGDAYFYLATQRLPASHRNTLGVEPILFMPVEKFRKEIEDKKPDYWAIDERLFLTYSNWGYESVSTAIKDMLSCQELVQRFDYWAIYKNNKSSDSCSVL